MYKAIQQARNGLRDLEHLYWDYLLYKKRGIWPYSYRFTIYITNMFILLSFEMFHAVKLVFLSGSLIG